MKNKSKSKIVALFAALFCFGTISAQTGTKMNESVILSDSVLRNPLRTVEFGVRYMPSFTSVNLKSQNGEQINGSASITHGFGVMLGFNFTRHIGILAELNYLQVNQKYADRGVNRELTVRYINIPVMFSLNTNKLAAFNLNFSVGPQFGINAGSDFSSTGTESDTLRAVFLVKQSDVGLAYGAGFELALNNSHTVRFDGGYRGFFGVFNVGTDGTSDNRHLMLNSSRKTYGFYLGLTMLF
jgi:hypothetical protein